MTRQNPWAKHYQAVWHERTADRRLPAWLRVAFLAYGAHKANGHAQFKPGDISLVLGSLNQTTGEIKPMDKHNVQRAISAAVESGWLSSGSSSLCLIVPAHAVQGGIGNATAECPIHKRKSRKVSQPVTHLTPEGESPSDPPVSQPVTHRQAADLRK